MIKVGIVSLGCSKNQVDSEIMTGILAARSDFQLIKNIEEANIIIINTCGFIQDAKEESINTIIELGKLKKTACCQAIVVTGCLTQRYKAEIMQELPEIDAILGTGNFDQIAITIDRVLNGQKVNKIDNPAFSYNASLPRILTKSHFAYVKIAEGCNNNCTYCSIPKIRGPLYSRQISDIITEIDQLLEMGVKEIILIAQDITRYGIDIMGKPSLPQLIEEILKNKKLRWLRLMYSYPEYISEELICLIAEDNRICNYLDLPIQHSSNKIRNLMHRQGSREDIIAKIAKIRQTIPGIALRTSLIVGFPGENESDYIDLIKFIKEIQFERLGIFKYSPEEDTKAINFPGQLSAELKEKRYNHLMEIQQEISHNNNQELLGKEIKVLVDEIIDDMALARSEYDAPEIDNQIYLPAADLSVGDMVNCIITEAYEYDLIGRERDEFTK